MHETQSWQPSMPRKSNLPRYVQAVRSKGKTYHYVRKDGARFRIDGEPETSAYYASYARILENLAHDGKRDSFADGTVGAMITAYKRSPAFQTLGDRTRASYDRELARLEPIRHFQAADVRRKHINAIRDALAGTPRTRQLFGQVCSLLWNFGIRELELDTINPAQKMRRDGDAASFMPWSAADMAAFEASNPPVHLMTAYMIGRYTGPRRGDITGLMRSHYDGTRLQIAGSKTGTPATVAVHERLKAYLDALPAALYLVADASGRPVSPDRLTKELRAHLDAIGLSGLSLHGLRHTAGQELAEAGCSPHEIAAVLGHRTLQMVERYTKRARQETLARRAIGKLTKNKPET